MIVSHVCSSKTSYRGEPPRSVLTLTHAHIQTDRHTHTHTHIPAPRAHCAKRERIMAREVCINILLVGKKLVPLFRLYVTALIQTKTLRDCSDSNCPRSAFTLPPHSSATNLSDLDAPDLALLPPPPPRPHVMYVCMYRERDLYIQVSMRWTRILSQFSQEKCAKQSPRHLPASNKLSSSSSFPPPSLLLPSSFASFRSLFTAASLNKSSSTTTTPRRGMHQHIHSEVPTYVHITSGRRVLATDSPRNRALTSHRLDIDRQQECGGGAGMDKEIFVGSG